MHLRVFGGLGDSALEVLFRFFPITFLQGRITHRTICGWMVRLLLQNLLKCRQPSSAVIAAVEVEISKYGFNFGVVHRARGKGDVINSRGRGSPEIHDAITPEVILNGFL